MDSIRTNHVTEAVKADMAQLSWVILGCGEMGTAIAKALRSKGSSHRLVLVQRNLKKRKRLAASGFNAKDTLAGVDKIDILVVTVKPGDVQTALHQARPYLSPKTWVISVAAGITYRHLSSWLPMGQLLFRIRPSIFVQQQNGNWLLAPSPRGRDENFERLRDFLGSIGNVFVLPETLMEQSTWESSSIPAILVPKILQLFVETAPEAHQELIANMMQAGLKSLLTYLEEQESTGIPSTEALDELCRTVVTPGGINDAAMQYLEQQDIWQTLRQAKETYVAAENSRKRRF